VATASENRLSIRRTHGIEWALLAYPPLRLSPCCYPPTVEIMELLLDYVDDVGHQPFAGRPQEDRAICHLIKQRRLEPS
jgi:hypothetical protein